MFSAATFALALLASVSAKTLDVQVGQDGLTYTPDAVFADVGDQVVFHFHPANHTVTETTFASVCQPKDMGIDSQFMPVAANQTDNLPTFAVTVKDTNPQWFYCKQAAGTPKFHCGQGMVFAINCPSTGMNTLDNFKAAALKVGADLAAAASASPTSTTSDPYAAPSSSASDPYAAPSSSAASSEDPSSTAGSAPPSSSSTSSPSSSGTVHQVLVAQNAGLTFTPSNITAQPGDVISFQFQAGNHTVTQSSFAKPCNKLADASGSVIGLDSGFMPFSNGSVMPTFNVTVNQTTPLWFYCKQHKPDGSAHCGAGMVFSVNSNETSPNTFSAFKAQALKLNGTNANTTGGADDSNGAHSSTVVRTGLALGAAFFGAAILL